MIYSEDTLETLKHDFESIDLGFSALWDAYQSLELNDSAKEFLNHGFFRRVKIIKRCINNVWKIIPPERKSIPAQDELDDACIYLQSHISNVFGCFDNLAWVLVRQRGLYPRSKFDISFGKKFVLDQLSASFKNLLESRENWRTGYLGEFRHPLAHRIPLYIPPFLVSEKNKAKYTELQILKSKAFQGCDVDRYKTLCEEELTCVEFVPVMTHSYREKSPVCYFHGQVLVDWKTVLEFSTLFISELKRDPQS